MTHEGVAAVDEAIRDLRREKPLAELEWSDRLAQAAADHVAVQSRSGAVGHYTRGRGPGERMRARGGGPYVNEVITYGHHSPAGGGTLAEAPVMAAHRRPTAGLPHPGH